MADLRVIRGSTAARTRSAAALPLVIERAEWGWTATGTRTELVAAGLLTEAHFPEGKKRTAFSCRGSEREWTLIRQRAGRWSLRISLTQAEKKEREKERRATLETAANAVRRAQQREESSADWKARIGSCVRSALLDDGFLRIAMTGQDGCKRLSDRDQTAADALIRRLVMVITNAAVVTCSEALDSGPGAAASSTEPPQLPRLRAPLQLVLGAR